MSSLTNEPPLQYCTVAVVGSGPAGLACAAELRARGLKDIVVLEREPSAGGVPRHCGHSPYGWRERRRLMRGPEYARWLVAQATGAGVEIRTGHSVIELQPQGRLLVASDAGNYHLQAERVVLATGARERSRAARLVGGTRPNGVMNTGALQAQVYLHGRRPFQRPVIVGSELVAFSALLTCRHAGMRPVAVLEAGKQALAGWYATALPALLQVPWRPLTRLVAIHGAQQVTGVTLAYQDRKTLQLGCDGVVFCGQFRPDTVLAQTGSLMLDPLTGGPMIDQFGRSSDPGCFVAGNVRRPVETAGWCWQEGRDVATHLVADLAGRLPPADNRAATVQLDDPVLRYVTPQHLAPGSGDSADNLLQLRVSSAVRGRLMVHDDAELLWQQRIDARPERRITVPLTALGQVRPGSHIRLSVQRSGPLS